MRPAVWIAVVAALALLALVLFVQSRYAEERARELLVERLERLIGREVRIESLSFELLPLGLELTGIEIGGPEEGDPPFATAARLLVEARVENPNRPILTLSHLLVEEPVVRLDFYPQGGDNLPRRESGRSRAAGRLPIGLRVGQFVIERGAIEVDHQRIPLALSGRDLEALLYGHGTVLEGRVQAREVSLTLPRARPFLGAVAMRVALEPSGARILGGRVSGPDLEASFFGGWNWRPERELSLELEARTGAALFDRLGYADGQFQGRFEVSGGIAWRQDAYGFRGTVRSAAMEILERRVEELVAVVSGDRNGLRVDLQEGTYGGGLLRGTVAFSPRVEGRPLNLDLILENVLLSRLLEDQGIPLEGVEGRVGGIFNYQFPVGDARAGNGWADLRISPPEAPPPGVLPVRGTAPLSIDRGVIRSGALRLASRAQRVVGAGYYDLEQRSGAFDYEVTSERIPELLPILPIPPEQLETGLWVPRTGTGVLQGTLRIETAGVSTGVSLDLFDLAAPGFSADHLKGAMEVSGSGIEGLRLELLRPEGGVILTGRIPFGEGSPEAPGDFELAADAAGWPLSDVRAWLPFELPLEGRVNGSLQLSGRIDDPAGELRATLAPAQLWGVPARELALELDFDPARILFREVVLEAEAGRARLAGEWERSADLLDLSLESEALDLGSPPLSDLVPGRLRGRLAVSGRLQGSLTDPLLAADLHWSELALGDRALGERGEAELALSWEGSEIRAEGSLFGLVSVEGGGQVGESGVETLFRVASDDLAGVAALLAPAPPEGISGSFAGRLELGLEATPGAAPRLALELESLRAEHDQLTLQNLEPVRLRLAEGDLVIDSLYLGQPGEISELFVAGRIGLGDPFPLDLRLQSTLASTWLDLLFPGVRLEGGSFDAIASVVGTLSEPQLDGVGELRQARLIAEGLPHSCEDLQGVVLFYPGRLVIDSARGRIAGGSVVAGGSIDLSGEAATYRMQFSGKGLNLRYPEGWLMRGDAEISLSSTDGGRQLRGVVRLDRAYYLEDIKVGLASLLQGIVQRRRVEVETTDELLTSTQINLQVEAPGALRVRNNLANLRGSADLVLRGTLARPVMFGRVELEPGGTLVYSGNTYVVDRGLLTFANPYRIEPVIDLVATTDLREYDVTLNLSGTLDRLNATFSSDPPLADLEVLALLTGGEALVDRERTASGTSSASVGAERFLYGQAASLVTERVNRLFGLDKLRIDPLTSTSGDLSSARVTVGKRFSRDLFATYSYDPSTTEEQILELEWSLSRSMMVVLTQNGDSTYAVDLRWEKAF